MANVTDLNGTSSLRDLMSSPLPDQNDSSFQCVLQRKLLAGFRILDTTSSGSISIAGFESILKELMPAFSTDDVRTLIECSGSCTVRYNEFVEWLYERELGSAYHCSPWAGKEPVSQKIEEDAYQKSKILQNGPSRTCVNILQDLAEQTDIVKFVQQSWKIAKVIEKHVGESLSKEIYHSLGFWLDLLLRVADTEDLKVVAKDVAKADPEEEHVTTNGCSPTRDSLTSEGPATPSDECNNSDEEEDEDTVGSIAFGLNVSLDKTEPPTPSQALSHSGSNKNSLALKGLDGTYKRPSLLYQHTHQGGVGRPSSRLSYMVTRCGGGDSLKTGMMLEDDEDSGSDCETQNAPMEITPEKRNGVSSEAYGAWNKRRPFVAPFYDKPLDQRRAVSMGLKALEICKMFSKAEIETLVNALTIVVIEPGETIMKTGDPGDALYVVLLGAVDVYEESANRSEWTDEKGIYIGTLTKGKVLGEHALLAAFPREVTAYAKDGGQSKLGRLEREVFHNFIVHREMKVRQSRQVLLRNVKMLEMMTEEHITQLAESLKLQVYEEGETIIHQGEKGDELFIMQTGEAVVMIETGQFESDIQEHRRFREGEVFGERSFLTGAERAASIIACTRVETLILSRRKFKRLFGSLESLQVDQYMTDPRKAIADFYTAGDSRGPGGSIRLGGEFTDTEGEPTSWFAVYRPTSRDAIAKMLAGTAVGKGLNIKGKSAKQGTLSGLVPFLQISDNQDKAHVDPSPPDSRVWVFFKSEDERERAFGALQDILWELERKNYEGCEMTDPDIDFVDDYIEETQTDMFGLDIPEALVREAYVMRPDITPMAGWETGRASQPAYMNMNLICLRSDSDLKVVLYQYDSSDPMNPNGLLLAYAEHYVKPVVSDFDTFLVGSTCMEYAELPEDQLEIAKWSVERTTELLNAPNRDGWTKRWLGMLKAENERGFHPEFPKFGFGDPVSYRLVEDVCESVVNSGAVRHGAECFNFYFPQELDDQYLVVWDNFPDIPWAYKSEPELRQFLIERAEEGFLFPLNPVWPVRDKGWYDVLEALFENESTRQRIEAWWMPSELRLSVEELHKAHPDGFVIEGDPQKNVPVAKGEKAEKGDKALFLLEAVTSKSRASEGTGVQSLDRGTTGAPRKRITGRGGDSWGTSTVSRETTRDEESSQTFSMSARRKPRVTGSRRSRISEKADRISED